MINKQAYRADGGDIGTDRIKEIANNPYDDEEKCWLAKRVLAQVDELEVATEACNGWHKKFAEADERLESAEKRIRELEALDVNAAMADIDMSDADCFTISRLIEIIYGSKLKWPEEKLLARFMHDIKQRRGSTA